MKKLTLLLTLILTTCGSIQVWGQNKNQKSGNAQMHQARFHVFNYHTKSPIEKAGIYDKANALLGTTNEQGMLALSLASSTADVYTIKAEGYSQMSIRLTQASKTSADYDVFLPEIESGLKMQKEEVVFPEESSPAEPELVKVYVKQDPATYKKTASEESSGVEFAVQLSATSRPISDKASLKSWEELGPVFIHKENGMYKVRIGPFDTQESAKSVLLKVKERGKKDAFIVVQKGIENHVPFDIDSHYDNEPEKKPEVKGRTITPSQPRIDKKDDTIVEYKVRLASYLKPGGFNTKDIDQYGPLESYRKGDWTIMLIGGFKTAKDAEAVRQKVVAKGYSDATVVVDRGGVLESGI